MSITINRETFHGIDTPLVLRAIKMAKFGLNEQTVNGARDCVADAVALYNPTKGMKMSSWIMYYICRQLKNYVLDNDGINTMSLHDKLNDEIDGDTLETIIADPNTNVERSVVAADTAERLHKAIEQLDAKGQEVMNHILNAYRENKARDLTGFGVSKGMTRAGASILAIRTMERLRAICSEMGLTPEE